MTEAQSIIVCSHCKGTGKVVKKHRRCKIGLHEWYVEDDFENLKEFHRRCLRCGKRQVCKVGQSTSGGIYPHYYDVDTNEGVMRE